MFKYLRVIFIIIPIIMCFKLYFVNVRIDKLNVGLDKQQNYIDNLEERLEFLEELNVVMVVARSTPPGVLKETKITYGELGELFL